jgi:pimeloyl-ACP methyl ester carboxylesterase
MHDAADEMTERETPVAAAPSGRLSRRALLRRAGLAAGALVAATAALAIADADRGEDGTGPLFSTVNGTGSPTIVFLPGIGATTRFWTYVLTTGAGAALAGRHLLIDLLGFGRSPKPWTRYDVERHVTELRRVLAPEKRITLVGHSLGARLAIAYAARYPEQVERLVLISLPYFGDAEQAKRFFRDKGANGWIWTHLIPMAMMCLFSRRLLGWSFPYLVTSVPRVVAEDLTQMTWRSSTSTIWEVIYGYDLSADMRRLPATSHLLCLHGDRDESAPLDRMRELQALHPNCVIRVQPGATHQLPLFHQAWVRAQIASDVFA